MTEDERVATGKPLDDTTARIIAAFWHGGMKSGLYSFVSTGFVSHTALAEAEGERKDVEAWGSDGEVARSQLDALIAYFRVRLRRCAAVDQFTALGFLTSPVGKPHPGRRDVVPGWNELTFY